MEDEDLILDNVDDSINGIDDDNLIYTIWTRPRDTYRFLFANNPDKYVFILLVLGGTARGLHKASEKCYNLSLESGKTLAIGFIGGLLFGWIFYYIYAWSISTTGKWLNGNASPKELRTVLGWAIIPSLLTVIFILPDLYFYDSGIGEFYVNDFLSDYETLNFMLIVSVVVQFILAIWTISIAIVGISLVQGFSIGKSILNYLLPIIVFIVPILIYLFIIQS